MQTPTNPTIQSIHALTPEEGGESEIPSERLPPKPQANRSEPRAPLQLRDNTVFIGKKNAMSYVLAVVSQFSQGSTQVKVKARGRSITRAVDVSQIVKNKFVPDLKISLSDVSTEDMTSEDGSQSRVSSLTLLLSK